MADESAEKLSGTVRKLQYDFFYRNGAGGDMAYE